MNIQLGDIVWLEQHEAVPTLGISMQDHFCIRRTHLQAEVPLKSLRFLPVDFSNPTEPRVLRDSFLEIPEIQVREVIGRLTFPFLPTSIQALN